MPSDFTQIDSGPAFRSSVRRCQDSYTFNPDQKVENTTSMGYAAPPVLNSARHGFAAELNAVDSFVESDESPLFSCNAEGNAQQLGSTHPSGIKQDYPSSTKSTSRKPRYYQSSPIARMSNGSSDSKISASKRLSQLNTHDSNNSALQSPSSPRTITNFENYGRPIFDARCHYPKVLGASIDHSKSISPEPLTMSPDGLEPLSFSKTQNLFSSPYTNPLPCHAQDVSQLGASSTALTDSITNLDSPVNPEQP